jgi:hypothetical protein
MDASPQQKDHCYSGSAPNQAVNQSALWFIPPRRVKRFPLVRPEIETRSDFGVRRPLFIRVLFASDRLDLQASL